MTARGTRRTMRLLVLALFVVGALSAGSVALGHQSSGTVKVSEKEWGVSPSPSSISAGKVTFSVKNTGHLKHEFIVLRTSLKAGKLPVKGAVAVLKGTVAGKIAQFGAGQTKTLTVTLKPGHYILLCNLPAHYAAGQRTDFNVK